MSWRVRLTTAAEQDIRHCLRWTQQHFGTEQRARYSTLILAAIEEIAQQPISPRSIAREELRAGLRSMHVSRSGGRASHFILFHVEDDIVIIERLLHQRMDFRQHVDRLRPIDE